MTYANFCADIRTMKVVLYSLVVIGEAARHVPEEVKADYPEIPWRDISDMRNVLIHEYFGVDPEILWETIHNDLPSLQTFLKSIYAKDLDSPLSMNFIPLYFQDKLTIINPAGTIGVLTLWSKVDYVMEKFHQVGWDLNPDTSDIAVFGTLYGNGLRELLRNLLYNPQIQYLLVCGRNRSGSLEEFQAFFQKGLEEVSSTGYIQSRWDR